MSAAGSGATSRRADRWGRCLRRHVLLLAWVPAVLGACRYNPVHEAPTRDPRVVWNRVYEDSTEFDWGINAFLGRIVEPLTPGRALDIGMGQGRNSLALAELGWEVTGFDISDEGVRQAREEAISRGLTLDARLGDVNTFHYGVERYDLIVATCMHGLILPRADEIVAALAPDGLLLIEGFHRDLGTESIEGGFFGYHDNELPQVFDDLRLLIYEDTVVHEADWGGGGPKPIVRFLARKR